MSWHVRKDFIVWKLVIVRLKLIRISMGFLENYQAQGLSSFYSEEHNVCE